MASLFTRKAIAKEAISRISEAKSQTGKIEQDMISCMDTDLKLYALAHGWTGPRAEEAYKMMQELQNCEKSYFNIGFDGFKGAMALALNRLLDELDTLEYLIRKLSDD